MGYIPFVLINELEHWVFRYEPDMAIVSPDIRIWWTFTKRGISFTTCHCERIYVFYKSLNWFIE